MSDSGQIVTYHVSGMDRLQKPGTYTVQVSYAHDTEDDGVHVYGSVVPAPEASDDVVESVDRLHDLIMRPLFVLRFGRAKERSDNPRLAKGGRTAARRAAAEIDRIVREWVGGQDG